MLYCLWGFNNGVLNEHQWLTWGPRLRTGKKNSQQEQVLKKIKLLEMTRASFGIIDTRAKTQS